MIANLADTGVTKVTVFRPQRRNAGFLSDIRREWVLNEPEWLTLHDFVVEFHAIRPTNSGLTSPTTKNLNDEELIPRHKESQASTWVHQVVGNQQSRLLELNWIWGSQGFQGKSFQALPINTEYIESTNNLYFQYGAYAQGVIDAVESFSRVEWQTDLCTLLSGLASATNGKFRPVVSVNEDDQAFELEARISATTELFFEVDSDGKMEVVLRSDQHGVKTIQVKTIVELLKIVRDEALASSI